MRYFADSHSRTSKKKRLSLNLTASPKFTKVEIAFNPPLPKLFPFTSLRKRGGGQNELPGSPERIAIFHTVFTDR